MKNFIRAFLLVKGQSVRRALTLIGIVLDSLTLVYTPWVYKTVFDHINAPDAHQKIVWGFWTILLIGIARFLIVKMEIYYQDVTSIYVGYSLRRSLINKMLILPFSFFDKKKTGDLMSVLAKDVQAVQDGVGFGILILCVDILLLSSSLFFMFSINKTLTLYVLLAVTPMLLLLYIYNKKILPKHEKLQEISGELHTRAQESISGIRVVKSFARENFEEDRFAETNNSLYKANLKLVNLNSLIHPTLDFISIGVTLTVLFFGGREIINGLMTVGGLMAFIHYSSNVYWITRELAWLTEIFQKTVAGAKRIFDIVDSESRDDLSNGFCSKAIEGHIIFEDVSFSYDDKQKILSDFNLEIMPGETVALLGLTGSGKSTVASLLARFYDPDQGSISLDGVSLKDWQLKSLRDNIGFVFQENFLFSDTVKDNVLLGNQVDEKLLNESYLISQAANFIEDLSEKDNTLLGERGVGLSGGERQRVSIARALVRDPQVIVFDDASSSLDLKTEKELYAELRKFFGKRTVLLITQRVSTAKTADKIVVLENGKISEIGTHLELLKMDGIYKSLSKLQEEVHAL